MICVLGRSGQVAGALREVWQGTGLSRAQDICFLGRAEADFLKPNSVVEALERIRPTLVINTAAYTAVDLAETEAQNASRINALAVREIAGYGARTKTPLIHFSTDYVYDGSGEKPWRETDPVSPLSAYGKSKAQGDFEIQNSGASHLIFRTSWVYHHEGKNFVRTMLRLGAERDELAVVDDQIGSPTSALSIARATFAAAEAALAPGFSRWGVYHMAGQGAVSWFEFATEIFRQARLLGFPVKVQSVKRIATSAYPTPARRPLNSRLDQSKLRNELGLSLPSWTESLGETLTAIKAFAPGERR